MNQYTPSSAFHFAGSVPGPSPSLLAMEYFLPSAASIARTWTMASATLSPPLLSSASESGLLSRKTN